MKILVTNDDGAHSPGLWALVEAMKVVGDVCVAVPDRDLSGSGTAITLLDPVRVQKVSPPVDGVEAFSVQGTPVDCVVLATGALFKHSFDLVVSGINAGSNIGLDVWSSGTVGAALRGYMHDISSVAISVAYGSDVQLRFDLAALAAQVVALCLESSGGKEPCLLNINMPDVSPDGIEGVELTRLGSRAYLYNTDRVEEGRRYHYRLNYGGPVVSEPVKGTDIWAILNNLVSITSMGPIFTGKDAGDHSLWEIKKELKTALTSD